ncbi:MAG: sigma-70 family RNA polymerase sigma factor [Abditibacteriota bacterium]|nr:sigma-70 family RNA polymerase sigma factor [Abditibacteriota bacterium]
MKKEQNIRVSDFFEEHGINKTSRAEGYYSEADLERQSQKEYYSLINSDEIIFSPQESIDILRMIANILPKIDKPKDKIVVEKYLMGFSLREICEIVGYRSPSSVHKIINNYKSIITQEYEEETHIAEIFHQKFFIYREPEERIHVEAKVAQARQIMESLFGFDTFIYPYDITKDAYKITLKHSVFGTYKLSQEGLVKLVKQITDQLEENIKDE